MDLGLTGKVAIVTAATSNIGRAIAMELANEGVIVIAVGRDSEAGGRLIEAIQEKGGIGLFLSADLLDNAASQKVVDAALKNGAIDILVNALGGNVDQGFFVDSDPNKWNDDIDLNFGTLLRMTHAVLPTMIKQKRGAIVNIGSTAGLVGDYMLPVYSAMKGAVHSFTQVLAKEVGQHGVRVNAVAPYATFGQNPEEFSRGSRFHPDNHFFSSYAAGLSSEDRAMRQRKTLLGKPFATPQEISGLVAYLSSDKANFVTGQIWSIDAGSLL